MFTRKTVRTNDSRQQWNVTSRTYVTISRSYVSVLTLHDGMVHLDEEKHENEQREEASDGGEGDDEDPPDVTVRAHAQWYVRSVHVALETEEKSHVAT